ncbi:SGNH/GDSL hydrolase family protein [Herbidospora cretacea]|uniref:SGNH/GDSL hydrolase family protein n=1 Tax=Herbidospora cretacea TaxID=28444 RepID=UPI000A47B3F5|nr:SGNH/GDSL hydrolase family protein [Herbidospora cretacea]
MKSPSDDVLWTTWGDTTGFHLMVADAKSGYSWRTAATLAEPGFETDRWIGNACLTGSGRNAVVVYAPRQFANRERLFSRGGFAATVDLASGLVRKLDKTVSLAYYNPGCGTGESAVLTQSGATDLGRTRLLVYDAATGRQTRAHEVDGQVTSAVPVGGRVVAAGSGGLEEIDATGSRRTLAATHGPPYSLRADTDGGVAFLEAHGDTTGVAKYVRAGRVSELARGPLTGLDLASGTEGRVFLLGEPTRTGVLPPSVRRLKASAQAQVSTLGEAVLSPTVEKDAQGRTVAPTDPVEPGSARSLGVTATLTRDGKRFDFTLTPSSAATDRIAGGLAPSPARGKALHSAESRARTMGGPYGGTPVDPDRGCAVARNSSATQVYQPHWTQVEWAANLAVQGALTTVRPAGWKSSGLPAWAPQGMYPRLGLVTGTGADQRVPVQILLGVLAQESNMWQASPRALEGVYGNPLVGNFYGLADEDAGDSWVVRWDKSDCGYGVSQVTDGMRTESTSRTPTQKQAIAVDYATNIAAGLRILEDKYNHTWSQGIRMNSGNPKWIENWFAALWAYNSGVQPRDAEYGNTTGCLPSPSCTDANGNWGLGWFNNPINPEYRANRTPFLNGFNGEGSPADAAKPEEWPYPEKVMGWAAFPIIKEDPFAGTWEPGYAQAWWTDKYFRTNVKPPRSLFCNTTNRCDPSQANPCLDAGSRCWWNRSATYKPSCLGTIPGDITGTQYVSCGQESIRYNPGAAEPADWNAWFKSNCSLTGVPSGSYIIDDVPADVSSPRGCSPRPFTNQGTFSFDFADSSRGYVSKIDFHQLGGGFNGHFWFGHSYNGQTQQDFRFTGTWRLNFGLTNKWARVLVHVPDHGSKTQQATYTIKMGDGRTAQRTINAKSHWRQQRHRWVSLGVFRFNGTPEISLSNLTHDGEGRAHLSGVHNVAWDAVAIQPLSRKPDNFVVAFGDSFTSGEGAATDMATGMDYDRETDSDGRDSAQANGCHRSKWAWPRKATLKDQPEWLIGSREENLDNNLDFHMVACSGAQTENLLSYGTRNAWDEESRSQRGNNEIPQLEAGFLDDNTTLVTMSIGGNDAGWTEVMEYCAKTVTADCQGTTMPGDSKPLSEAMPEKFGSRVLPSVERVLLQINQKAPNATIALMGYPRLLSNLGSCLRSFPIKLWDPETGIRVDATAGISLGEALWLNDMADELAERLELMTTHLRTQHVNRPKVWFVDPRTSFEGNALCGSLPGINGPVLTYTQGENPPLRIPDNPWFTLGLSAQSFHPNLGGTSRYASTLMTFLRRPEIDM